MAINKKINKRIDITLPNSQYAWVENQSKKLEISKSKFISWILAKRIKQIVEELQVYAAPNKIERDIAINNTIDETDDIELEKLLANRKSYKEKHKDPTMEEINAMSEDELEAYWKKLMQSIENTKR